MASESRLCKSNTSFCLDLLPVLSKKEKNVFYSPFSISTSLAMVLLGARGNTAAQMSEVLGFTEEKNHCRRQHPRGLMQQQVQSFLPNVLKMSLKMQDCPDVDIHPCFAQQLSELNKPNASYALSVASRLYGEQSYQFVENFKEQTRKHYNAELETVDFVGKPEEARVNINSWVEKQTQGKIKDVVPPGVVDSMTRLVLVNAIYFKGKWDKQFKEGSTRKAPFKFSKSNVKEVQMMHQKSKFVLTSIPDINCKLLEMPYKEKELSMLIFLPNEIEDETTGLEKLESSLTYETFMKWTSMGMGEIEVQVGLPKFKLEEKYDMKEVLIGMGMVDAFDMAKCDFSGMSPANNLVISEVLHKAFVEVNEEGTEAAAATAGIMMMRCLPQRPVTFIADHPFLFFIRHNPSKSILFAGRYCSPELCPSCFQKIMATILTCLKGVAVYLDDIVVHGVSPAAHDKHLGKVMELCSSSHGLMLGEGLRPDKMASETDLPAANTTFCLDLSTKLSDNKTENLFFSPFSISSALTMVTLGARGETRAQMSQVQSSLTCMSHMSLSKQQRTSPPDKMASAANTAFCLDLSTKLSDNKTENLFFSPFSISSALTMVTLGARGETRAQMSQTLKMEKCHDKVHSDFAQLLSEINKLNARCTLSVANRLYGEQSFQFVENFLKETRKYYNAALEPVDFIRNAESARQDINKWVETQTQGKIKDLLAEGVVDSMTRMVLVNAIYFKGNWNQQFKENRTTEAQFRVDKNTTKTVKMMRQRNEFPFKETDNCKILEMPYIGKELSMLIILPKTFEGGTGLETLEKSLTYENFVTWTEKMYEAEVDVGLPKFKLEEQYDMKKVLVSMGMVDAFDMEKCDFSGMSSNRGLVLSDVVHRAFVEVNEEGTVAAAATAPVIVACCCPIIRQFIADHPFLFFIRHNPSKSVLFAGRYCSPE
ncbi:uncharacterized protein KZ484_017677 [Pholidichthys leucotaenia]